MIRKPIPYGRQHIIEEDIQAVVNTLKSDYLTQGPKIPEFEQAFARYVGAKYAVAVNNATAGLHLAASALGVKPGDKVILPPMTFAASANCIRYCGNCLQLILRALLRVLFRWILRVILTGWKSSGAWPTNTICGYWRTPVMLLGDISPTVKVKGNIVATETLPMQLSFLSIR